MITREGALEALLAVASGAYAWQRDPSRRLKHWTLVPKPQRPALFQSESGQDVYDWKGGPNPKRTFTVRWFIYIAASDDNPGAPQLAAIRDALDDAMTPSGGDIILGRNTLGGACYVARIKSVPVVEPGDMDDDGIMVVDVDIILP